MSPALKAVNLEAVRFRLSVESRRDSIRSVVARLGEWIAADNMSDYDTPRILVVDDDELVGRAFSKAGDKLGGVVVDHVKSIAEAVDAVAQMEYDGCIVDLGLNGLGTTFCQHVRHRSMRPLMPMVLYTGEVDREMAKKAAFRCGANRAMLKSEHGIETALKVVLDMCEVNRSLGR